MDPGLVTILVAVLSGTAGSELVRAMVSGVRRTSRRRQQRESALARAIQTAHEWETVARVTRAIAIELGAPLKDIPLGPGERPLRSLADGDAEEPDAEEET